MRIQYKNPKFDAQEASNQQETSSNYEVNDFERWIKRIFKNKRRAIFSGILMLSIIAKLFNSIESSFEESNYYPEIDDSLFEEEEYTDINSNIVDDGAVLVPSNQINSDIESLTGYWVTDNIFPLNIRLFLYRLLLSCPYY